MKILFYLVLSSLCVQNIFAYNFLAVFPVPGKSHHILASALVKGLANAGHNITFITAIDDPDLPKNVETLFIPEILEERQKLQTQNKLNVFELEKKPAYFKAIFLNKMGSSLVETILNSSTVQTMLKSDLHFDAVIIEQFISDGLKIFAYHYQAPLILFSSVGPCKWVNSLVANPAPPSYVADVYADDTLENLTFYNRLCNFLLGIFSDIHFHYIVVPRQNAIVKQFYPNAPHITDYLYNISLVLLNSHESFHKPVPLVPNMIGIGGFHINPSKKLPNDLQKFMDGAKEGVIYFSLGSNVVPSTMPREKLNAILKVLGSRKEKVLWKWDQESLENVPDNFIISKWFPQQGILAHPNCKLFISHAGLLSTTETVLMGVPVLMLPLFGDQKLNAARAAALQYGVTLPFQQLNEESFSHSVNKVLKDPKYRNNAQLRSKLLKDRPVQPLDLAIYWVEYVARYKGAPHLRVAGIDLPLYQYLLLDVIVLLLGIISAVIFAMWKLCKFIQSRKCNKKVNEGKIMVKGKELKTKQRNKTTKKTN